MTTTRAPHPVVAALLLGGVHAIVDAASVFVLFRDLPTLGASALTVSAWIVAYDVLAFALQTPLGLLADRWRADRSLALVGLTFVGVALGVGAPLPRGAAALAGIGNALFHVGAGAFVLRGSATRAREAGFFVGPGVLGLSAGILLGRSALACRPALALACLAALAVSLWTLRPGRKAPTILATPLSRGVRGAVLGLLLLTVSLRALLGDTLTAHWRAESTAVIVALALAACAGKMLGGLVADRFGWPRTALVALVAASLPMLSGLTRPVAAVTVMLLLQATMPLTLKAVHVALPQRPGLAFGLPSLALLIGSMPGLLGLWPLAAGLPLAAATGLAAVAVVLALRPLAETRTQRAAQGPPLPAASATPSA